MATKFLRKIILEELQKVLKEEAVTGVTGDEMNVLGRRRKTPVDTVGDLAASKFSASLQNLAQGPEQKKAATIELQKKLVKLGFLEPKDIVGNFGPKTTAAINAYLGANSQTGLNPQDVQSLPASDVKSMVAALDAGNKQQIQQIVVKFRASRAAAPGTSALAKSDATRPSSVSQDIAAANQGRGAADVVLNTKSPLDKTKPSATPAGPEVNVPANIKRSGVEQGVESDVQKYGTKQEAIVREINKLLRSL